MISKWKNVIDINLLHTALYNPSALQRGWTGWFSVVFANTGLSMRGSDLTMIENRVDGMAVAGRLLAQFF